MPSDADFAEFFGLDRFAYIGVDNSPRYPVKVLEETEEYVISTSPWGVTFKNWKHRGGVPEFLDFTIVDRDSWQEAKARMTPTPDRIPWDYLKQHYRRWREEGYWISAGLWFGFDVTHSWAVGTERVLLAIVEDPEWLLDMFNHFLDVDLALLDMLWEAGYTFDEITWPDDMGYKGHQFFSVKNLSRTAKAGASASM
jgi:uroporphyrinogen decarboxylase